MSKTSTYGGPTRYVTALGGGKQILFLSARAFGKLSKSVQERDGGVCRIKLPGTWPVKGGMAKCLGVSNSAHHTLGRKVTGDDERYMVAACMPCNQKLGDPSRDARTARSVTRTKW